MCSASISQLTSYNFSNKNPLAYKYFYTCQQLTGIEYRLKNSKTLSDIERRSLEKRKEALKRSVAEIAEEAKNTEIKIKKQESIEMNCPQKNKIHSGVLGNKLDYMA